MSKKSILYMGAGLLLITYAVLDVFKYWFIYNGQYGAIASHATFNSLSEYLRMAVSFWGWVRFALLILIGVACGAKALLPDLVPDIAFVGLFGLLTLVSLLVLWRDVPLTLWFRWRWEPSAMEGIFQILAFGAMAAILLLKDSFGMFFFVPSVIQILQLVIKYLFLPSANNILVILVEVMLALGLLLVGRAVTDN